jgi:hypothetical protein
MASQGTNAATQAIVGSAAINNATIVPSLSSVNDGLIHLEGGIELPQQGTTFTKDFYQSSNCYVYPQTVSSETLTFQFTTPQFLDIDTFVMQVPIAFTFTFNATNTAKFPNPITNSLKFGNWAQPSYALQNFVNYVQFKMGSNNWPIDRPPLNYIQNTNAAKIHGAIKNYYLDEELKYLVPLGLPFSTGCSTDTLNTSLFSNAYIRNQWQLYMSEIYLNAFNQAYAGKTQSPTKSASITIIVPVICPLSYLSSFFSATECLPPNVQLRFDLILNQNSWTIMSNPNIDGNQTSMIVTGQVAPTTNANQFVLYSRVKQPIAEQMMAFNQKWISSPLVYLVNDWEYFDFISQTTTGTFNQEIQIATQRPTQLFFCIRNTSGSDQTLTTSSIDGSQVTITNFANEYAVGFNYTDMRIVNSGFNELFFRKITAEETLLLSNGAVGSASDFFEGHWNMSQYKDGYESATTRTFQKSFTEGLYYIVTIEPNYVKLGYRAQDPGSTTININMTIKDFNNNPIDTTKYTPRVFRRLETNVTLDYTGKVSVIQWPALPTSSGASAIQQTFNTSAP